MAQRTIILKKIKYLNSNEIKSNYYEIKNALKTSHIFIYKKNSFVINFILSNN